MKAPILCSTGPISGSGYSNGGWSTSTARSIWLTWMNDSPSVRGIDGLSCTMTVFAAAIGLVHRLDRHAQRAEAVRVGRGHVGEHRVQRVGARS